jgi:hypothetical protein
LPELHTCRGAAVSFHHVVAESVAEGGGKAAQLGYDMVGRGGAAAREVEARDDIVGLLWVVLVL